MKENELLVNPQHKIVNYLFNACFLCIILAYDNFLPWFYENYVQLYFNANKSDKYSSQGWLDFYGGWTCPERLLKYKRYRSWFFKEKDIINFIEESIDNGNYLYTYIDEYFIENSMNFGVHFVHDTFIYGYDKTAKEIKVIAFDKNMNFTKYSIDYRDFEISFMSGLKITAHGSNWSGQYCVLIKCKYNSNYVYKFKLDKFTSYLSDYLNSINTSLREKPNYRLYTNANNIYGISIYDYIVKYLNTIYEQGNDLRYPTFHTLYEHKVGIYDRLKYIGEQFYISNKYSILVNDFKRLIGVFDKVRMLAMKYNFRHDKIIIDQIVSTINTEKEFELKVLTDVLSEIDSYKLSSKSIKGV